MFFGLILDIIFQPQISAPFTHCSSCLRFFHLPVRCEWGSILLLFFYLKNRFSFCFHQRKSWFAKADYWASISPASHTYQDMNVRHFNDIRVHIAPCCLETLFIYHSRPHSFSGHRRDVHWMNAEVGCDTLSNQIHDTMFVHELGDLMHIQSHCSVP